MHKIKSKVKGRPRLSKDPKVILCVTVDLSIHGALKKAAKGYPSVSQFVNGLLKEKLK